MADSDLECIDCASDNTRLVGDGTGLCKCDECGAYFEVDALYDPTERHARRFDDDDRY